MYPIRLCKAWVKYIKDTPQTMHNYKLTGMTGPGKRWSAAPTNVWAATKSFPDYLSNRPLDLGPLGQIIRIFTPYKQCIMIGLWLGLAYKCLGDN